MIEDEKFPSEQYFEAYGRGYNAGHRSRDGEVKSLRESLGKSSDQRNKWRQRAISAEAELYRLKQDLGNKVVYALSKEHEK